MRTKSLFLFLALISLGMIRSALPQTPQLLVDINRTGKAGRSSYPSSKLAQADLAYEDRRFARVGTHIFFKAHNQVTGYELFYADAARDSGKLAADINPGTGSSNPSEFLVLGGKLYFEATDGTNNYQIFEATVGTGGVQVRRLTNLPGTYGAGYFGPIIGFNGYIYFTFSDTVSKSYLIHRLDPSTKTIFKLAAKLTQAWTDPVVMGSHVAFGGRDYRGRESWWMDGSTAGLIADYQSGEGYFKFPVVIQDIVYFAANTGTWDILKWGPKLGMKKVATLPDGKAWATPVVIGTKIFYRGDHGGYSKPHVIDTAAATPSIKVMPHESSVTYSNGMDTPVVMGNKLYYYAHSAVQVPAGHYLFVCDGVTAKSIPGTGHHYSGTTWVNPLVVNGMTPTIFFRFKSSGAGNCLYKFAGSNFSRITQIQANLYRSSNPWHLTELGGKVLFSADDGRFGSELWESDGTALGTQLHSNLAVEPQTLSSSPNQFVAMGRKLFFTANDGIHGRELWVIDSNPAQDGPQGARLVTDLNPGLASANPQGLIGCEAMGLIFFHADDGTGSKLHVMDMDLENPIKVGGNALSAKNNGEWAFASKTGDWLVGLASDSTTKTGKEPHIYNKAKNQFDLIADTNPGVGDGEMKLVLDHGDAAFSFLGLGDRVYKSKGTPATTKVISQPSVKVSGDLGLFLEWTVYSGKGSTGKPTAYAYNNKTRVTKTFHTAQGVYDRVLSDPFVGGNKLYYGATVGGFSYLHSWDGSAALGSQVNSFKLTMTAKFHNTQTQKEEVAVPFGIGGNVLYFPLMASGIEIWRAKSKGVKRVGTTVFQSISKAISLGSNRVAVIGKTAANGEEVYVIDDTKVAMVSEPLAPGFASGVSGGGLWAMDGKLVFSGYNYAVCGAEPFVWSTGALAQPYGVSGTNGVRMTANNPVLGKSLNLRTYAGLMSPTAVAFLLSRPSLLPLRIGDNRFYLNLSSLMIFIGALNQGVGSVSLPIPVNTGLVGLNVDGQAIVVDMGLAMGLSQAMSLNFGN